MKFIFDYERKNITTTSYQKMVRYDRIRKKKDEYRVFNEYYIKRLTNNIKYRYDAELHTLKVYQCEFKKFNKVKFHYGYTKKNMSFEIEKIHIAFGKIKWGGTYRKMLYY